MIDQRRRARPSWLLAAAAALVVVIAGVGTVVARRDGGDVETALRAPAIAPGASEPEAMLAALVRSAEATAAARTANVVFRVDAEAEVAGGRLTIEVTGTGQVEMPGRAVFDIRTTTRAPAGEPLQPPAVGRVVEDGRRTFVRCQGEADYTEQDPGDAPCFALGPDVLGPDATIDMIEAASALDITAIGRATLAGRPVTGYRVTQPVELDGQRVALAVQIWVDDDSLIRQVVGEAEYGDDERGRTSLVVRYQLTDFGVAVDIPELG